MTSIVKTNKPNLDFVDLIIFNYRELETTDALPANLPYWLLHVVSKKTYDYIAYKDGSKYYKIVKSNIIRKELFKL